jgi:hypothetical protein
MVTKVLAVSLVAMGIGLALGLGARKLESWSVELHRRAPHLLPLRRKQSVSSLYVWMFRLFGAIWALAGLAILYYGS